MKHLIAIDSDGTLRKSDGTISAKTKEIISRLINDNNIVVICTARPRYHTLEIASKVNSSDYLISSNGTEIYDNKNKKIIYGEYLPKDLCMKIYEDTKKLNIRVVFVCENTEYVTKFVRNKSQILINDDNINELFNYNIKQVMVIDEDKDTVKKYEKELSKISQLNMVDSSNFNKDYKSFSMISSNASKGNALKILANYLNIPMKNTIAIGNDKNDISMIKMAGIGVAVANATDDLKKYAKVITNSNDDDGVANYLEKLLKD